jgi:hypothetical protein
MAKVTTKAGKIQVLGLEMIGVERDGEYFIATTSVESALGWRHNSGREKLTSKSLETFTGKALGKGKVKASLDTVTYSCVPVDTFMSALAWEASEKKNPSAIGLLVALATEALDLRIDRAVGINRTEVELDKELARLYVKHKKDAAQAFRPKFTDHLKAELDEVNYAKEVIRLKRAGGLPPMLKVEDMTYTQLHKWETILLKYDTMNEIGMDHETILAKIAGISFKSIEEYKG